MRSRVLLAAAALAALVAGCASQPAPSAAPVARQPVFVYAYQQGEDPKNHTKHTLFLMGEGPTGSARYTAASFQNGARYSLASSGNGSYAISGNTLTVKAGGLDASGEFVPGKHAVLGGMRFTFGMKM